MYKTKLNQKYVEETLMKLLSTPSPSGFCHDIMREVEKEVLKLGFSFEKTNKGNGLITIQGASEQAIGLSAHVDTLGAMVRSITGKGTLKLTLVGGYMLNAIEGEYCKIHTRDGRIYEGTILTIHPSVHVYKDARDMKRDEQNMEVRIDEIVHSKSDVEELGISVGDFISFDARPKLFENGFVKSRHLDDKASVAALFGLMELISRENLKPSKTIKIFITTYEEVGHGAAYIPENIDEFIAIDMGAIGDDLSCSELDVSICAKDSSGPYDYDMTSRLIELAKEEEIDFVVDIYPQYGSDASAALRGGNDIRAALIGPGVHASHTMERTHMKAVINTGALIASYIFK
ncbi:M42 family metallopeptidase [Chengkuizengella axinellae]|uniref:M42 family metallopeptidase n=1 Tax=Chengkuizengella axinellae TaxID=3064388 RepID=A0ABT9IYE2_9BACL|nr:M42 family metallopeptidase [Chengkuizengella sp. 2205SS18-9]MDP5274325.1 M42 family metallopeptidase [Chengkuizengella sp. 2205SS18-9]